MTTLSRVERDAEERASDLRAILERELRERLIVPTEVRHPQVARIERPSGPEPTGEP